MKIKTSLLALTLVVTGASYAQETKAGSLQQYTDTLSRTCNIVKNGLCSQLECFLMPSDNKEALTSEEDTQLSAAKDYVIYRIDQCLQNYNLFDGGENTEKKTVAEEKYAKFKKLNRIIHLDACENGDNPESPKCINYKKSTCYTYRGTFDEEKYLTYYYRVPSNQEKMDQCLKELDDFVKEVKNPHILDMLKAN